MPSLYQVSASSASDIPFLLSGPGDGQAAGGPLVFKFSEAIQVGNGYLRVLDRLGYGDVHYFGTAPGVTVSGDTLVYQPSRQLTYNTEYRIEISAYSIKDLDGNPVGNGTLSLVFRTGLSAVGLNLTGTWANEHLEGSDLDDVIDGAGGGDAIYGHGGDDILIGDDGAPTSYNSRDVLIGGAGNDTLYGGYGDDELHGDEGNDKLYGGDGFDILDGGAGDDLLEGGAGNDTLSDSEGNNRLLGGDGGDTLRADSPLARGVLDGGADRDHLFGYAGLTYIGGDGDDQIEIKFTAANGVATTVDAGAGDDLIDLSLSANATGKATLSGGAGSDIWVVRSSGGSGAGPQATIVDFTPGAGGDQLDVSSLIPGIGSGNPFDTGKLRLSASGADTVLQLQRTTGAGFLDLVTLRSVTPGQLDASNFVGGHHPLGSNAPVTLTGNDFDNLLRADTRDTTLLGLGGRDELYGGDGNDTLDGGSGDDKLDGGKGNNILRGGAGNDQLTSNAAGTNLLDGGAGDDRLIGGAGNDTLLGGDGRDTLSATSSVDGGVRTVTLDGGAGDDTLVFGAVAGTATVRATGGAGADRFEFGASGQQVVITDLGAGDVIDLSALLPQNMAANPFGAAGFMKATQQGADVVLQIDRDGAAGGVHGFERLAVLSGKQLATLDGNSFVGGYDPKGGSSGSAINGTERDDFLTGTAFDDTIAGGAGDDVLHGLAGNDVLHGGAGNDKLMGHDGDDALLGDGGEDVLEGGAGNDTLEGGAGNDVLRGGTGVNILRGGDGNDVLDTDDWDQPNAAGTTFDGGAGDDYFAVSWSVKSVVGGSGNDQIEVSGMYTTGVSPALSIDAGDGDDRIVLGGHTVTRDITISGGAGRDEYIVRPQRTPVDITIRDFQAGAGGDLLDLSQLFVASAGNPFASGHLRLVQDGARVQLQVKGDAAFSTLIVFENASAAAFSAANFSEGWSPDGAARGETITGSPNADQLVGGRLADILRGGDGNDEIYGNEGDDRLEGGADDDVLDGGAGIDSALYDGARGSYLVHKIDHLRYWQVEDGRAGAPEGTDRLFGMERLLFGDGALALDLTGAAGQAYRIYRAAFDRTPDEAGLGFWIDSLDRGVSLKTAAAGFIASQEFIDLYGAAPGNAEIVTRLYRNILDREPEQAGYDYWFEILDSGRASLADVLAFFSESAENVDAVAQLIGQGIAYQPWEG